MSESSLNYLTVADKRVTVEDDISQAVEHLTTLAISTKDISALKAFLASYVKWRNMGGHLGNAIRALVVEQDNCRKWRDDKSIASAMDGDKTSYASIDAYLNGIDWAINTLMEREPKSNFPPPSRIKCCPSCGSAHHGVALQSGKYDCSSCGSSWTLHE